MIRLWSWLVAAAVLGLAAARADTGGTNTAVVPTAPELVARMRAQRAARDFSLKARLLVTREEVVPLEILVQNRAAGTRTVYRSKDFELLVVQPDDGPSRFYVRGRGELTGAQRRESLLGSQFSYYDLGLDYLHWPGLKLIGNDRFRGQDCWVLEARSEQEPLPRVRLWVHRDSNALLKTEAYDRDGEPRRRFEITSIQRVGDVWVPRGLLLGVRPQGQALPAEETSRLQVYDGRYDVELPETTFDPGRFAPVE